MAITEELINKIYDTLISKHYNKDLEYFESKDLDSLITEQIKITKGYMFCQTKNLVLSRFKENGNEIHRTHLTSFNLKTSKDIRTYIFFKIDKKSTALIPLDKTRYRAILKIINEKYGRVKWKY